ncbi:DNA-binding transcriptional regulator, AcrR family [Saccharopolyspora antimicrobica]|uniref:DNA-binding transcriptional regulator, AcrR family n=1 Tax=Saccharopolyspora antimicrobica TaxID=455193 RepID=A0A1I4TQY4_9PSEU|nr:TetR/AcrR family transcriptional regulator [Saccharopolyspora antimicrobica]RKT88516.1 TetR family transcriptional regulator [Saccharopolyspora antimicrobica]SFM79164.1 DNA-binding transcriptional regulator, AcrR family [Saccharopolyspora antimicrobica]
MGLRDRRKRQTRQEISDIATRLFTERGFDEVTIAQVAAAAGVAKMTVTNHFPRKEDLVLDIHEEFIARLGEVVAGRTPGESPLAALRRAYFEDLARRDAMLGFSSPSFARLITESPTLLARLREIHEEREAALAAVLARETDEFTAALTAAHAIAVHRALFREVQRRTLAGQDADEIAAALEPLAVQAFDALQRLPGAD